MSSDVVSTDRLAERNDVALLPNLLGLAGLTYYFYVMLCHRTAYYLYFVKMRLRREIV